ncbi:PNPLA domain-containing protein [Fusarium sp. LHS14.1]|nr:PNPLA domain-containing protein [Fusarium sp. LHS14.1]
MVGGPNPLDESGLCMLSFDGGGVRGLSSLYILDHIMRDLNHQRALAGQPAKKPCEIFDLIGGTSTGGLIAIMLGRLEMDVTECIAAYCKLSESVFKVKKHWSRVTARDKIQPRFDSQKLKAAIETVLKDRKMPPTAPFNDRVDRGCKVFVCATSAHSTTTRRLRSYDTIKEPSSNATIVEVAMATSAATTFFEPVTIDDMKYLDGGLGANNPVDEVVGEARYIMGRETEDLKPLVKCFISIGTGNAGMKPVSDNFLQFVSETLVRISTNTESTADRFALAWRDLSDAHRYFRFNVEQGLQDVELSEYKESGKIKMATQVYLEKVDSAAMVGKCVANLKTKQKPASKALAERIEVYNNMKTQLWASCQMTPPASCQLPCYCLPFTQNRRFVGREKILENLSNILFGEEPCDRVALTGLGGVGKTQAALQFAFWVQREKPDCSVFWLSALSASSFQGSCNTTAIELNIFKDGQDSKPILKRFLSSKKAGPWLIIADNADEKNLVFGGGNHTLNVNEQLPNGSYGRILFTTRSKEVALEVSDNHVIEIDAMDHTEARIFLENSIVRKSALGDGSAVAELLEKLTYLPLAIAQAAAYLNRNLVTIDRYLELLQGTEQEVASLLSRDFHDRTRYTESKNAVATTWWVSFNQIVAEDCVAADLLRFISRIEAKAIPLSILPRGESMEQLTYSVGTLCAYTFLLPRDGQDIYDMHSLVHLATRLWVETSGLTDQTMMDACKHLAKVFLMIQSPRHPGRSEYMPHALRLLQSARQVESKERFILSHRLGIWLEYDGRPREAIEQHEQAFIWARDHLAEDDPDRFKFEDALARAYRSYEQAQNTHDAFQQDVKLSPWLAEVLPDTWQGIEKERFK